MLSSMQTPGTDIRTSPQRSLVVAAMPRQSRLKGQFVAVIGPTALYARRQRAVMTHPLNSDVHRGIWVPINGSNDEVLWAVVQMKNHFELKAGRRAEVLRRAVERSRCKFKDLCAVFQPART